MYGMVLLAYRCVVVYSKRLVLQYWWYINRHYKYLDGKVSSSFTNHNTFLRSLQCYTQKPFYQVVEKSQNHSKYHSHALTTIPTAPKWAISLMPTRATRNPSTSSAAGRTHHSSRRPPSPAPRRRFCPTLPSQSPGSSTDPIPGTSLCGRESRGG